MSSLRKGLFFRKTDVCLSITLMLCVLMVHVTASVVVRDLCRHTGNNTHINVVGSNDVGLMLAQRRRRWANIKTTLCAGMSHVIRNRI